MTTFEQTKTRLEEFIANYSASQSQEVDLSPGSVLSELVVKLAAALQQEIATGIDDVAIVNSVQDAINSGTDTYSPVIDKVASNYNVVRDTGKKVAGNVKVVVSENQNFHVSQGFSLFSPALQSTFVTTATYRIVPVGQTADSTLGELPLYAGSSLEPYYFLLPVEIADSTTNSTQPVSVPNNAPFELGANTAFKYFVSAKAFGAFASGRNKETDKALIQRFNDGLSCKGLMSVKSIKSLLKSVYPSLSAVSVVGSTDREMTRTKHNIFGISTLGMVDVYIRTSSVVENTTVTVTATYQDDCWNYIGYAPIATAPGGFYRVLSVTSNENTTGSYAFLSGYPKYSYSSTGSPNFTSTCENSITTSAEARYSKYQTLNLKFKAPHTPGTDTVEFKLMLAYMPYITEFQDYLLRSDNRILAADYLVKAVVPCSVFTTITLYKSPDVNEISSTQIASLKKDIVDYINGLDFGEGVVVSKIVDICHNYPVKRVDLPLGLRGTIWLPSTDGHTTMELISEDVLQIPNTDESRALGVSQKTTMFFADYMDYNGNDSIVINVV